MEILNRTANQTPDLTAQNVLADAHLRNNLVRARNDDVCCEADAAPAEYVTSRNYTGRFTHRQRVASWEEDLRDMQRVLATMQERGASQERVDWQKQCIATHMERQP